MYIKRIRKFVKQALCFLFYCYCVTHTHTGFSFIYIYIYIYIHTLGIYVWVCFYECISPLIYSTYFAETYFHC